jgi:hypothetical protein
MPTGTRSVGQLDDINSVLSGQGDTISTHFPVCIFLAVRILANLFMGFSTKHRVHRRVACGFRKSTIRPRRVVWTTTPFRKVLRCTVLACSVLVPVPSGCRSIRPILSFDLPVRGLI